MLKKEKLYKFYLKVTNGGSMLILTRLNKKKMDPQNCHKKMFMTTN